MIAYRHADPRFPFLWESNAQPPGRWHGIGEGPVQYLADTPDVMRWYRELLPSLPEELNGWIALLTVPPAPPFPEELWGRKAGSAGK